MKSQGQINYEGYADASGWKSVISGAPLPQWDNQHEKVRACWEAAARAVLAKQAAPRPTINGAESSDVALALEQCDKIVEICDEIDSEEGEEFADSVREKVVDIREWIENNGAVTANQKQALDNMEAGASKWVH